MSLVLILHSILFLVIPFGFFWGGGSYFELRNYHYIVIFLSFIWYIYAKKINLNILFLEISKGAKILLILSSLVAYIFDILSKYYALNISGIDFSIFEGMLQNFISGRLGYEDITDIYHFGVHQNWILFLIFPIYYLFPSAEILLLINAFILWLPGLLLIRLLKIMNYGEWIGYLAAIFWWTTSFTVQALHGGFYPESFYPVLLFLMIIFYLSKKNLFLLIAVFLFLSVKEDAILYVFGFFFAVLLKNIFLKDKNTLPYFYLFCIFVFILFFIYINFFIVKPYFLSKQGITEVGYLSAWWSKWGESPTEIIRNILTKPHIVILDLYNSKGWLNLYLPMLFIPLLKIEVLFASLPVIILYGISNGNPASYSSYYPLVLWVLAIYGLFSKKFVPQSFLLFVIFLMPLLHDAWLGVEKIKWKDWNDTKIFKANISDDDLYCVHPGLWPYISSTRLNLNSFQKVNKIPCYPVFSLMTDPFPQKSSELEELYEKIKNNDCVYMQLGAIIKVKNSNLCRELLFAKQ